MSNFTPGDQFDSNDIICPYCGYAVQAESEDVDENPKETECEKCGKTFVQYASISIDYYTEQKP